jgi:ElaB/YqjD/DUF883 family membrane-anchored ribosome-binding protein
MATRTERQADELGETVSEAMHTLGVDLAKTSQDAGEALRKTRRALNASAQEALADLKEESAHAVEGLKAQVKAHPITYVAAAAGIGLAIGFLLRRH